MRTRVIGLLTALVTSVMVFTSVPAEALPTTTTVTVHYKRFAGDYTGWNIWLWGDKSNKGAAYQFTGEDAYGMVGTFKISTIKSDTKIGIIARLKEWEAKDISADRFITQFSSPGVAEVWLLQADPTIYYTSPVVEPAFVSANIDTPNSVTVSLNEAVTPVAGDNGFSITGAGNPVITSVATDAGASSTTLIMTVDKPFELGSSYVIQHSKYGSKFLTLGKVMNSAAFNEQFTYTGNDLGNVYTAAKTDFRLWAPTSAAAQLLVYPSAASAAVPTVYDMTKSVNGTWTYTLDGDQAGTIYTYKVNVGGSWREAVDPYVKAATVNGTRGVVVDLAATDPTEWVAKPAFSGQATDAVFYELHVRDLSIDPSSGISAANRGRYLGLIQTGTKTKDGRSKTGIDAIKELGVTHVQLLPIYDYKTVDENYTTEFNWGYDPQNYNVPEGSYSSQPRVPTNRIIELKQAVNGMHQNGLRVVMDVVYNHVYEASAHSFEQLVPGYYFRKKADGAYANGTGVGNEVASERPMVRNYIVDSVKYWASQYHLDGFRFDLMGILDVQTLKEVRAAVDEVDPSILLIGEGWNMGDVLPVDQRAYQGNISQLPRIGMFNDRIRDGIKGSVFNAGDTAWAQGNFLKKNAVQTGIIGNIEYNNAVSGGWGAMEPGQSVNYVEAHDNLTLFDKLNASMGNAGAAEKARVFRLASSVVILAQGMPFLHAGQEFMRSKGGDDNSYKSPDSVNSLKWKRRADNMSTVKYFKGLLALRKSHPAFRMPTADAIRKNFRFIGTGDAVIGYWMSGVAAGDSWTKIAVIHNGSTKALSVKLPAKGNWQVVVEGTKSGTKTIRTIKGVAKVVVAPQSTMVLHL